MIENSAHFVINCPIEELIPAVTEAAHLRYWVPGFVSHKQMTSGEIGMGTTFQQVVRMGKSRARLTIKITHFDPPTKLSYRVDSESFHLLANWNFGKALRGTEVYYSETIHVTGWMFKIFKSMFRKSFQKRNDIAFNKLQNYLGRRQRSI
jgi:uncharacterized protein YndB with AHSA1/START domain